MIKLSSRNKFFLIALSLHLLLLPPPSSALLQGNRVLLVDDFDDQDGINRLGGKVEGDAITGEKAFGERGASLALNYEMGESSSSSYFWLHLGKKNPADKTIETTNFSEMGYLSLWIRLDATSSGKPFQLYLEIQEDTNGDKRFVLNPDVSDRVLVASFKSEPGEKKWRKVTLSFSQFRKIRHWERIVSMALVFESGKNGAMGTLLVDNLLLGSNYPDGGKGREIQMQNRVSSFKIDHQIAQTEVRLKRKQMPMTLTLTFIDPYLEEIRFEESRDGGQTWQGIHSFYDHESGGVYTADWDPRPMKAVEGLWVRVMGVNVLGAEKPITGSYHVFFN